jgi:hypothetical protein
LWPNTASPQGDKGVSGSSKSPFQTWGLTLNVSLLPQWGITPQRIRYALRVLIWETASMSEIQLDLLSWRPPAEIIAFPAHRSHGCTASIAKTIIDLDKPARSGKLNSLRAQTRKRLEPLFGKDRAERMADDLVRQVRLQIQYREHDRGMHRHGPDD